MNLDRSLRSWYMGYIDKDPFQILIEWFDFKRNPIADLKVSNFRSIINENLDLSNYMTLLRLGANFIIQNFDYSYSRL